MRATAVQDGILGSFRFDRNGDMTPAKVTILRITGRTPPALTLPALRGRSSTASRTVPASRAE